ncbi:MAG: radical SAM protein [Bacillota bacterium]
MIRISAGSAAFMGLSATKMDAYPTTAYFLSGNRCLMNCAFCPQGAGDKGALNRLGRVTWPEYSWTDVEKGLTRAEEKGLKRICLQSVRYPDGIDSLLELITRIKNISSLPLSLSAWLKDNREAVKLVEAGVDRISVSLDVVNPSNFKSMKGGSLQDRLDLLFECAKKLPGLMSTHIICGLGESEREVLSLMDRLVKAGVTVALFAFVPLKGTTLEKWPPPPLDSYRRIQAGYYLLRNNLAEFTSFRFDNGRLVSYGCSERELRTLLNGGYAFQTSGCPHCNRPFYNERPGGIIYNYHRRLKQDEEEKALNKLIQSLPVIF